ncbi:Phospholipid/glycerol acyltransferase (fragment) [Paraburkholderia ribeironis]|uniref:Phospholipid/glycerol acyltransferase n=1 Tax=Paraburkholderia ribeironis TaxID=1247936 RepID=A0A1N7SRC8_9BURK
MSASRPVQPVCMMYEDAQGRQSTAPAYIGEMSLRQSLDALLRGGPLTAHVYVGAALAPGADRRLLAVEAEQAVGAALAALQDPEARRSGQIADRTQAFIDAAANNPQEPLTGPDIDLTRHA